MAFCTLNFLFHHFLWSLYSDAMVDVIDVVEDITGDLSELVRSLFYYLCYYLFVFCSFFSQQIQDLGKESVSALQNREVTNNNIHEHT